MWKITRSIMRGPKAIYPKETRERAMRTFQDKGTQKLGRPQSSTTSIRPSSMAQKFVVDSETDEIAWTEAVE